MPLQHYWAVSLATVLGCAACSNRSTHGEPGGSAESSTDSRRRSEHTIARWQEVGAITLDEESRSEWTSVPIDSQRRFTAIALFPEPAVNDAPICVQIAAAELVGRQTLVSDGNEGVANRVCSECTQRVTWGQGHGLFSFPNQGEDSLPGPSILRFRAELRHCAYGIRFVEGLGHAVPKLLRVFTSSESSISPDIPGVLHIRAAFVNGSQGAEQQRALENSIGEALSFASQQYAPANLALHLEQVVHLAYDSAELVIDQTELAGERRLRETVLSALNAEQGEVRFIPVVFVPCLRVRDARTNTISRVSGQTTSSPGHIFGPEYSSACYIAWGDCRTIGSALSATSGDVRRLGNVIAHEVGHYLGLHHIDGAASNSPEAPAGTLMSPEIAGLAPEEASLSATQCAVVRRHLDVAFEAN